MGGDTIERRNMSDTESARGDSIEEEEIVIDEDETRNTDLENGDDTVVTVITRNVKEVSNKYKLFVSSTATCALATTTSTEIVEITAPVVGANNGVNVYMCVDGYNVDGANSKTAVDGLYVGLMDTTSTAIVVACGTAVLA